ncbi:hypothetical protein ACFFUB_00315 [Algimonas porphyrae]|uniref:ATP-binding protein n=1 Tax=Algimonas porphyrae TaxID=1128113 RepID=A0ABQ5V055_9PROT|nr:hypothetical protein [Algimonas porphyrae]GLQ20472.1 hypothetical protein GCM10007854_14270 [Algimonas porphyrae]
MRHTFCREVSNAVRFMDGVETLKARGAVESSWMLVEAEPGLGKSSMFEWYSVQEDVPLVRAKADWTVNWMLKDVSAALGIEAKSSSKANYEQIISELMNGEQLLMVDEINHAARRLVVIETLRDITDMTQTMLLTGGHKGTLSVLKPHKQIYDRIGNVVELEVASIADIKALCRTRCEVEITDEVIAEIHQQTGGNHRRVMNAIARVEALGRRRREAVTLPMLKGLRLTHDNRARGASA